MAKKQIVDTPYAGCWAESVNDSQPAPTTNPVHHEEDMRMLRQRLLGTAGYSPEDAAAVNAMDEATLRGHSAPSRRAPDGPCVHR